MDPNEELDSVVDDIETDFDDAGLDDEALSDAGPEGPFDDEFDDEDEGELASDEDAAEEEGDDEGGDDPPSETEVSQTAWQAAGFESADQVFEQLRQVKQQLEVATPYAQFGQQQLQAQGRSQPAAKSAPQFWTAPFEDDSVIVSATDSLLDGDQSAAEKLDPNSQQKVLQRSRAINREMRSLVTNPKKFQDMVGKIVEARVNERVSRIEDRLNRADGASMLSKHKDVLQTQADKSQVLKYMQGGMKFQLAVEHVQLLKEREAVAKREQKVTGKEATAKAVKKASRREGGKKGSRNRGRRRARKASKDLSARDIGRQVLQEMKAEGAE